jgi:hypothetical protein
MNLQLDDYVKLAEIVLTIISMVVVPIAGKAILAWGAKQKAAGKADRLDIVRKAARVVYWSVEAVATKTPGKIDDKLAEAMKRLVDQLGEVSVEEVAVAKGEFSAMAHLNKTSLVLDPSANLPQ